MRSEVDFVAVFMSIVAPLVILTPNFVIMAANNAYLRATERTEADLVGQCIFTAFPGNPDAPEDPDAQGQEMLRASLARVVATCKWDAMPVQRYDIKEPGEWGAFKERYWSMVNAPVLGQDGEVELIIHRAEEVTDFLQELRRSGGHGVTSVRRELDAMETNVYVRAHELQELNERLKRAHSQQGETMFALQETIERQRRFVFDASHDLRSPITGLLAELEDALAEPDIDLRPVLPNLLRGAERLNEIVADLLELARLDTVTPATTEPVDLGRLVVEELEGCHLAANVRTRLDQQVVARASQVRLARLLCNLVSNAERHATSKIEIIVTADPPDAVLEVIDDGPGIAPVDREKVFERLVRLDDARRRDPGGSGLGLPIARAIAQSFDGRLYAADHPTGARLVLRLPLAG
jgi:signal transduction histidine kinase